MEDKDLLKRIGATVLAVASSVLAATIDIQQKLPSKKRYVSIKPKLTHSAPH